MSDIDLTARAEALLASGRGGEAVQLITAASRQGNPDALFQQALWHLIGAPLPRDLPEARRLLKLASAAGSDEAGLMEARLAANGSGGSPDWQHGMTCLGQLAENSPEARAELALLGAMKLTDTGLPTAVYDGQPLTPDGSIQLFPSFASAAECNHIAALVSGWLSPALVADPRTGLSIPHPIRTSEFAVIGPTRESLPVRAINQRIAAASGTDVAQGEALSVLRYKPGQQYRMHLDTLGNTKNERCATFLLYLNGGFQGGETVFPDHGLEIRPREGDGLLFRNTLADGRNDGTKRHAGRPVRTGEKWLATRWIRTWPFSDWKGPDAGIG